MLPSAVPASAAGAVPAAAAGTTVFVLCLLITLVWVLLLLR